MSTTVKIFVRDNKWIIAASVFFIIWKFFLIGVLWDGRHIAPEPDDSAEYIGQIASVATCQHGLFCNYPGVSIEDHSGFTYLSYRLIFGIISKISGLSPADTFYFGFYIGTVFLALILPLFLSVFTNDRRLIAFSVFFLSFYHGTGESHGFYWVVPSFFALVFFLLLFRYVSSKTTTRLTTSVAILVALLYAFAHPISPYLIFVLPLTWFFYGVFSKQWDISSLKKISFVTGFVLVTAFLRSLYLSHVAQIDFYGFESSLKQAGGASGGIAALHASYFCYLLPHWIAIFPLLGALLINTLQRSYRLLALYISAFTFFVAATLLHEFGFRSAILIWPMTYILYAFAAGYTVAFLLEHRSSIALRRVGIGIMSLGVAVFLFLNAILAIGYNLNMNVRNDFIINPEFSDYLVANMRPDERVAFRHIALSRFPAGSHFFFDGKLASFSDQPRFLVTLEKSYLRENPDKLPMISRFAFALYRLIQPTAPIYPIVQQVSPTPINYSLSARFGDVNIYERQ